MKKIIYITKDGDWIKLLSSEDPTFIETFRSIEEARKFIDFNLHDKVEVQDWTDIEFFNPNEFRCKCCKKVYMDLNFVKRLNYARSIALIPFIVTSGYRCEKHNREIGGKENSAHLYGKAADILCNTDNSRFIMVSSLLRVGFKRLGISKGTEFRSGFIHVDDMIDNEHPPFLIWLY